MSATGCALSFRTSLEASLASTSRCTRNEFASRHSNLSFPRSLHRDLKLVGGRSSERLQCRAEGEGSSCCGGSDSKSGGGGCSSHKTDPALAKVGKEFEALVASKTMEEFEEGYVTGQMEGTISRDVVQDVVNIFPEALASKKEERFIDVDELLAEAMAISNGELIFDSEFEDMMV
ncbi:hypothetical protein Mapa_005672 [Marchantia paleacea]|nr:hypothetical protein Mapa_005672 [Marchantia paleacea]